MKMKYGYIVKTMYFRELLRQAKKLYSWEQIRERTGIAPSTLSRYLHGRIIPSPERLDSLITILEEMVDIRELILNYLATDRYGYLNNQRIISDIGLLKFIAIKTSVKYGGTPDVVLSPATDGVPYATLVAEYLGTPLVIAKDRKEVGVQRHIEASVINEDGSVRTLYIARGLINKNYRVLIVDDVIRTGETHRALLQLVKKAGAIPIGIHVIVAVGERWRSLVEEHGVEVDAIVQIGSRLGQG